MYVLPILASLTGAGKICMNVGGKHFDACRSDIRYARLPDAREFRISLLALLCCSVLTVINVNANIPSRLHGTGTRTPTIYLLAFMPGVCLIAISLGLLWATRPPQP